MPQILRGAHASVFKAFNVSLEREREREREARNIAKLYCTQYNANGRNDAIIWEPKQ